MESGGGGGSDDGVCSMKDNKNYGNLRLDAGASRRITQPSEPSSPQPSVDRLSVSFAPDPDDNKSLSEQSDFPHNYGALSNSELSKVNLFNMAAGGGSDTVVAGPPGVQTGMRLSTTGVTDEDDDYSVSMTAILHRRASAKKIRGIGKRRTSSPLDSDRRRSSVFTTSSGETAITMEGEGGPASQEAIFENIRLHKEVLESVKQQPWEMSRKLKLVQQAKEYVRRHEGQLQERLAQSKSTKDIMARFNILIIRYWHYVKREAANMAIVLTPWEMRIKEIESHFGSVVASYFTFLRWVFWINIVITAIIVCLVIIPEVMASDPLEAGSRKNLLLSEIPTSTHLSTLWDFQGVLKYSPMFYGYYTKQSKTKEGYPLPLSYFLTGLAVYVYSFVAILRRMAKNSRQSKLSEKDDECIFSWKLFTGWDYMIGNPETAFNRFASITMGFKEALLEEKEKKKDERNWKIIGLRVLANILVILLLATSAFAVIKVVERSEGLKAEKQVSWLRENEITLVMSMITNVFPNFFELIGMLEKYHPRRQLRWQLARIMSLNFLNLYTLIIALFGNVDKMTIELEIIKKNLTQPPTTMTPIFEVCGNVSVDCTLLNEYYFIQNVKHTKDILTLITTAALITKYVTNGTIPSINFFNGTTGVMPVNLDQREIQDLMQLLTPKLDLAEYSTKSPDLGQFNAEVDDHEYILLNDSEQIARKIFNLRPVDESTLKIALPLILKLFYSLIPNRDFPHTTPPTFFNTTYNITSSNTTVETTTTMTDSYGLNRTSSSPSTISTAAGDTNSPSKPYSESWSSSSGVFSETVPYYSETGGTSSTSYTEGTSSTGRDLLREVRETITEKNEASSPDVDYEYTGSNNLVLAGPNSYQYVVVKASTRGDIPGHVTESEIPSTTPVPEDTTEKLLTDIILVINMIVTQNSSRTDYAELSTMDKLAEFVTTYRYQSKTRRAPYPYNTTVSADFKRKSEENDTKMCYIYVCENGTITPSGIVKYLNCSDTNCVINRLLGNNTTCYIPGSSSCMTKEATVVPMFDNATNIKLSSLCWETGFGQELVKLTVMDLIFTVGMILVQDFIRAILVRVLNPCWCWDLEKKFPQYGDFKIAENILHLVNNQGMIWMGMFFSPGLPAINLIKLVILMYIRSWTVMTCNVPHETVFRASRSNNFYFALLLFMLFLCTLPVGYAIVWLTPSWHCGPFSDFKKMYNIFTTAILDVLPVRAQPALVYIASPAIVIPLLVLLVLIIYYLLSLTSSLREANTDLKSQLRRERTEERRKMFKIAGGKNEKDNPFTRWNALIPVVKSVAKPGAEKPPSVLTTGKQTGFAGFAKRAALKAREKVEQEDGNATDVDQMSLPEDIVALPKHKGVIQKASVVRKPSCTDSLGSIRSEIPVIKISKEEDGLGVKKDKIEGVTSSTVQIHPVLVVPTVSAIVEPSKKERVLRAIIDKSKKDRSQTPKPSVVPEHEEQDIDEIDFSTKETFGSFYFLNVDEFDTDVRRYFIEFQTGFESQT